MKVKLFFATTVMLLTAITMAFGGVYIEGTTTQADDGSKEKSIIYINSDRMRVENGQSHTEDAPDIVIFRQDKKVMWVIDTKEGTYMEITQKDLEQMKARMDEGMKQMQEQLKNMPPEQRKMMEDMMAKQMPKQMMAQEKTTYKKTGSEKFNSWNCDKYEGTKSGKKTAEVWTVLPSQAGFRKDDFVVMRGFADFFTPLGSNLNDFVMMGIEEDVKDGGFNGMPVKYINMDDGKIVDTFVVDKVENRSNAASLFELPGNLEKKEIW
jgi:hypothetical protein